MAKIPDSDSFNTNNVDQVVPTTKVKDTVFNGYFEQFLSNDARLKEVDDKIKRMVYVTLNHTQWVGSSAPYTMTLTKDINNNDLPFTANDNPALCKKNLASPTEASLKAYNKAFGIVANGSGVTGAGSVTFTVWKIPATTITVGLKGV